MRVVSASTELKVFSTLRGLMLSMLGAHETSVVQDEAVLQWLTALRLRNRHGADAVTEASEQDDTAGHIGNSDGADDVRSAAEWAGKRGSTDSIPTVEQCTLKLQEVLSASEAERIAGIPLDSDAYWKLVSAVTHRLTRKRILVAIIRRTDQLIAYFENAVRITKGIESVDPVEKASADAPVIPSEDTVQEQVHQQEESCSMLWHSLVGDGDCLYETMAQAQAQQVVDGHRKPSWDYLKRYKRYVWDATNPLQWPEL